MKTKGDSSVKDRVVAYKHAFSTEQGKIVRNDLMNKFHVLNSHKGDPFAEGQRSVVLFILQQMHVNLEELDNILNGD